MLNVSYFSQQLSHSPTKLNTCKRNCRNIENCLQRESTEPMPDLQRRPGLHCQWCFDIVLLWQPEEKDKRNREKTTVYTWYILSNILGNSSMRPNSLTNTTVEDPVFNAWTWNKARQVHISRVEIKKFVLSIFHCVLPSGFSQFPGSAPPPAYAARLDQIHRPRKYHVNRNSILVWILRNKTIFWSSESNKPTQIAKPWPDFYAL